MKKIIYSTILLFALMLNACDNDAFLEIKRPPEFGWKNMAELEFAAVSPYSKYFYGGWGAMHGIFVTNQVMMSDYFKFLGNSEDYSTDQLYNRKWSQRITEIESNYTSLYTVIGLANNGLNFVVRNNGNPFKTTDSAQINEVKRIKGELLFMRANAYYQLATTFCPAYNASGSNDSRILVKRDSASYSSIQALNNAPAPTSEIYDLMVSDLIQAKNLLPAEWADGMHESYKSRARANKWAAKALLAQVYFTMGKFTGTESALTELDDVINNGGYSLSADPFLNFNNQSINLLKSENPEVILWAYYSDTRLTPTNLFHNSFRYTHFNKSSRDATIGGNGNNRSGTKWSNFHTWLQITMSKSALIEMGWMSAADSSETLAAKSDLRYYSVGTGVAPTTVNQKGLFYRYEGAYVDSTAYRIAKGVVQKGQRSGASDDGKYIVSSKHGKLIKPNEPVVLVNKYYRSTNGYWQNIPVIRLAELYLNRAMIKKRVGDDAGAAADYNNVASRAWNVAVGGAYVPKTASDITERLILVERWKELAGEDSWYIPFCQALGYTIGKGDRVDNSTDLVPPYTDAYWSNSIPLAEIDFQMR